MVRRNDIKTPPMRAIAENLRELRDLANQAKTGAAGEIHLGAGGDVVWPVVGGTNSVKRFQVDLDSTAERADELEERLDQARDDLDAAGQRLGDAEDLLDQLDGRVEDAEGEARRAPRVTDRAPTVADGDGRPEGTAWLEYDPGTQTLVQMWRWTGVAWEALPMDPVMIPVIQIGTGTAGDLTADRIIVTGEFVAAVAEILQLDVANLVVTGEATINSLVAQALAAATAEIQEAFIQNLRTTGAVIDEAVIGDLAANIVTSGLFRTAETGQRLEIDSNGIVMWGVDEQGIEFEMVRIGPSGENLLTVGGTTVAPDSVTSPEGNFGELTVGGVPVSEVIGSGPRGIRAWGQITQSSSADSDASLRARRAELQTTLEPGRMYRVSASPHYVTAAAAGRMVEFLHYSFDSTPIPRSGAPAGVFQGMSGRHVFAGAEARLVPGMDFIIDTGAWSATRVLWVMFSMQAETATGFSLTAAGGLPLTMMVEDLGPSLPPTIKRWNDNNVGGGQDVGGTPVRTTKTYASTGFRCYNLDGSDAGRPDVVHGLYAGGPSNFRRRGGWLFPSMTGDLAGATIEKIEAYLSCTQTWASTGSTVNVATWGSTMANNLTAFTSVYGWKSGQARWVTLPASLHAGFKSGAIAGVGVIPTSASSVQYARFSPSAQIRITYTK